MAAVGVGTFASLKWHLVASRWRGLSGAKVAGLIVGGVALLALLGYISWSIASTRGSGASALLIVTTLYVSQLLGWLIGPLVAFGIDETVDPQKFALLPLERPVLQRGLLVSSLVGYLPAANIIVMVGCVIALTGRWWTGLLAAVCAVLQLVTCEVFSRAASTSMAALMSSRRGRDLGMLVGFGVLTAYILVGVGLNVGSESGGLSAGAVTVAEILTWTPPGSLAVLPALVAADMWGRAAVALVTAVVFLAAGWWWWSRALKTSLTTIGSQTESSAPSKGLGLGTAVADSVGGTARVVAGRDVTLMWRDPMRRMSWLLALVMITAWPFLVFRGAPTTVFGCAFGSLLLGVQAANQFGIDGSGLWLHMVAFADRMRIRGEMFGHSLVIALPSVPLIVVAVSVVATITGSWVYVPAALGLCISALWGAVATGSLLSVLVPYAVPQSRKSVFASSVPSQRGKSFQASVGTLLGGAIVALPALGAVLLTANNAAAWGWAGLAYALLVAPFALVLTIGIAVGRYANRGPEILQTVMIGDRS